MRIDFSHNPYMTNAARLSYLQRRVLVHCILYYEMYAPVISDDGYTELAQQLVQQVEASSQQECEKSRYWYCMSDFDASTGYDLYERLSESDKEHLSEIANAVRRSYNAQGSGNASE